MALQAAVPDSIEIGDNNDNNNYGRSQDHQECANNPDDDLFSDNSNDENDDNDPNDKYSQSTNDEKKKKKKRSKRKTPTSAIRNPRNAHWAGMRTPEEGEAADVLVDIGAEQNVARFMVMDGLDCVT